MHKTRLEAFSDAVIAIVITIMVLEMKIPHGAKLSALKPLIPVFFSYVMSFVYLGIYWNNHHHLFQAVEKINGRVLLANLHLLFWLSLIPFVTGWMGENHFARWPVVLYGVVLLFAGFAYFILVQALLAHHHKESLLAKSLGTDIKGKVSIAIYAAAIFLCWVEPLISCALYALVAVIWLVPDRRIEKNFGHIDRE